MLERHDKEFCSRTIQFRERLAKAAGLGFVSIPRTSPRWRIIKGMLRRGFRRPELTLTGDGELQVRAHYGDHRITRTFAINADGSLPDQTILAGLRLTAARMDARRPGGAKKGRAAQRREVAAGHSAYVVHGNEQAKLHELIAAMPPSGGMAAYIADMSAGDGADLDVHAVTFLKNAA